MPGVDEVITDTGDLPDASNLPRSEEEILQLLALLQSKSEKARESNRRLRMERFKASKARRQAQPRPECQPLPECSQSTGSSSLRLRQEADERISKMRASFEVSASAAEALSLLSHLESAVVAWPEEERSELSAVFEFGRQRLEELMRAEQVALAPVGSGEVEESDGADSDASEDARKDDELRHIQMRKEAITEELARWACEKAKSDCVSLCLSSARVTEDGESTSASRGTSASRDLQKDHPSAPSSARSCSDAGCMSHSLDFGMQQLQSQEEPEAVQAKHGGGKSKGKGAKGPPPPPKAGAKAAAKAKASSAAMPANNGFQNFFWQVSKGEDAGAVGQDFEKRLEAARVVQEGDHAQEDSAQVSVALLLPQPPVTVFTPLTVVDEMPQRLLDLYWRKRERGRSEAETTQEDATARLGLSMLDQKELKMLGISLKRHEHQNKGVKKSEANRSIKMAILRCDFNVVCIECLSVIRTVVKQHESDGKPVCAYVAEHGEEALRSLKCAQEHHLVHELSKVPQIVDRLECMLFHETFSDSLSSYKKALATHRRALEMLNAKRETIQRFFMTALRLGQSLNRRSRSASQAPNGFQLASLEKLSETKSTKMPKLSVLHFVLALMSQEDAQALFDVEDLALLQEAAVFKTHKVFMDCVELVQGLYGVQQICNTGQYVRPTGETISMERRRRSLPASRNIEAEDADVDDNDHFFEVMSDFVDTNLEAAEDLGEGAFNLILAYKELAIYFDDMRNVYPPPKTDNDPRKDLVEVFAKLAEQIQQHRSQVENEKLRELLNQSKGSHVSEGRGVSLPGAALRSRADTAPDLSPPARASEPSDSTRTPPRSGDVTSSLSFGPSAELAMTPEA